MTKPEIMAALETNPHSSGGLFVDSVFHDAQKKARNMRPAEEKAIPFGRGKSGREVLVAQKWLPQAPLRERNQLCLHRGELGWMKHALGMGSDSADEPRRQSQRGV